MSELRPPGPVDARGLFEPDRKALVHLLGGLEPEAWSAPTVCAGWDVRDITLHVLGGDLANIARRRDGVWDQQPEPGELLGAFINRFNSEWVRAARRLSPRLIGELLAVTGPLLFDRLESLDPLAVGGVVSWAGPERAPNWLDVAREYMERWVHQQHIREAVRRPGQNTARFCGPVVAASVFALPLALRDQPPGTVSITVKGAGGGHWTIQHEAGAWRLGSGRAVTADCRIAISVSDWWRLVTLGIKPAEAARRATIEGDGALARSVFGAVAIIA